jgi:hypothetical protein
MFKGICCLELEDHLSEDEWSLAEDSEDQLADQSQPHNTHKSERAKGVVSKDDQLLDSSTIIDELAKANSNSLVHAVSVRRVKEPAGRFEHTSGYPPGYTAIDRDESSMQTLVLRGSNVASRETDSLGLIDDGTGDGNSENNEKQQLSSRLLPGGVTSDRPIHRRREDDPAHRRLVGFNSKPKKSGLQTFMDMLLNNNSTQTSSTKNRKSKRRTVEIDVPQTPKLMRNYDLHGRLPERQPLAKSVPGNEETSTTGATRTRTIPMVML